MKQHPLKLGHEIVVDLFAGGGGASLGIEWGIGRPVDVAINHDPDAIAQHQVNHPHTAHYCESVFIVDPREATGGQPVGLLWASPDCTHFSRAKGGKPAEKRIRGLAWVVVKWARRVKPRVIMLENVEEFQDWGPLTKDGKPCPVRKGKQFREWVRQLERAGYNVEYRILRACDYGAPTIRRRLFVIARRDGLPIRWPEPTHDDPESKEVKSGKLLPWPSAADCIDWSVPCPSIFERKRPLAENTQRRIARGIQRFVLEAEEPFIVGLDHQSSPSAEYSLGEPVTTVTSKARHLLCAPYFVPRHGEREGQDPRTRSVEEPLPTVTGTANGASLVAAFLAKHYGGNYQGPGNEPRAPLSTVTARDHNAVVATHLSTYYGGTDSDRRGSRMDEPVATQTTENRHALVAALMAPYYGSGSGETGRDTRDPSPTVTSKDRLQLVTVTIDGETYVLTDIGMRMLQPHELYAAQGFPDSYVIDRRPDGTRLTKTAQVRLVGNSVPPHWPQALVSENFEHEQQIWRAA